ncbi:hypothetical protein CHS0354_031152 [Potamilus streckersoni]|uniref:ubiquitinyl hydrolase 1 n=1 Tax=Potamilus streckersoni TaxID=2493646 RepID=A0AAE0TKD2_9BIVA|nr:hypothetical protein CHS0354_031152 [Potamilus streckersoni]
MLVSDESIHKRANDKRKMAITLPVQETDNVDAVAGSPVDKNKMAKGAIDLTNDSENDDIQKAIAASLQDTQGILGGQISKEEQDISRVLEQSLIESKAGTKRKRGDIWFVDPLNPHERKRQDGWPVGLKNVGNTCWFSAVIQSLFHLRRFKQLVLNYRPPKHLQGNAEERRNLRFMQELRHLFALMVGSQKKYVDPSRAVDILKEAFSSSSVTVTGTSDSQQDVSEFQHKLLEWLEDAFKTSSRPSSPQPGTTVESVRLDESSGARGSESSNNCDNPMAELFYGQYRAEGFIEGKGFTNEENFGQFPLQVNGFRDIHESLEATTAPGEIETASCDSTQKSGQELWFTRLPPVLTFELSRFQFNQQFGRPEKIHNKIEFPEVIYMDRYMEINKLETKQRREEAKKLKEDLLVLQARLDRFINFGSGRKRFPLQDVLLYALEFAKSKPDTVTSASQLTLSQDIEMESPRPHLSMVTDSPVKSPPADVPVPMTVPLISPMRPHRTTAVVSSPSPREVSESELKVLQDCLHRWRTEVENDVRELQENIGSLEDAISKMYSDENMKKFPYHLHAVLVHEGQAASGHYWAYMYDTVRKMWLKFNDITVSVASWEELEKESVGGYHNASAYCLMYVDKKRLSTMEGDEESASSDHDNLPDDLKEVVVQDNKLFADEIEKWDQEMTRKASGGGDADVTVIVEHKLPAATTAIGASCTSNAATQTMQTSHSIGSAGEIHSQLSFRESIKALSEVFDSDLYKQEGPEAGLNMVIENEWKRIQSIELHHSSVVHDPRLQHIVVYLSHCGVCSDNTMMRVMMEQFMYIQVLDKDDRAKQFRGVVKEHITEIQKKSGEKGDQEYQVCHEIFRKFLNTTYLYIKGVEHYLEERFEEALPYILNAYIFNHHLMRRTENAGLIGKDKIVSFWLKQNLLHLNNTAAYQFESQQDVKGSLSIMNKLVLPCLPILLQSGVEEDTATVEEIRGKWCAFLGQDLENQKVEKLQDFLSKLFDPPNDMKGPPVPHDTIDYQKLAQRYTRVMELAVEGGYIERALKT